MTIQNIGYLELLRRNGNIRRLWLAQVVSELGDWLSLVALMQLIKQFSGSAQAAGLLIIIEMLPLVIFSPLGGIVADKFDRKKILIIADVLRAFIAAGFLLVDSSDKLWLVYLLTVLQFSITAFFEPARAALVPNLADEKELIAANALSSVTWSLMLAIGGALGGFITALVGTSAAFVVDSSSFVLSALILVGMKLPPTVEKKEEQSGDNSLKPALEFLRIRPRSIAVVTVKTGLGITAGGVLLLSVVFGQKVFPIGRDGEISVGLFYAANGVGSIVGAVLTNRFFKEGAISPIWAIFWAFLLRSLLFITWAVAPNFGLAILATIAVSATGSLLWVASTTLLQQLSPDEMRGRLFSIEYVFMTLSLAVSIGITGRAVDVWQMSSAGVTLLTAAIAGGVTILWGGVVWKWSRWKEPKNYLTGEFAEEKTRP